MNWHYHVFKATTDPGTYWLLQPMQPQGTAILSEGQYPDAWQLGLHRGQYLALVQVKPVTITRDYKRVAVLDLANIHEKLGTYLIAGYTAHTGYSKSLKEGLERHKKACLSLIKQLNRTIDEHVKKGWHLGLQQWNEILAEWISEFSTLKKRKPYVGKDYSDDLRSLKSLHEENLGRRFSDDEFNEIFSIALGKNPKMEKAAVELDRNILGYLMAMDEATDEWDKKASK